MRRFKIKSQVPPGGVYSFRTPDTDAFFSTAESLSALIRMVRAHYTSVGKEPPANLDALIEDFVCRGVDPSFCEGDHEGRPQVTPLTVWHVLDFTRLLFQKLRSSGGDFFVSRGEAERRASICAKCPKNAIGICTSCTGIKAKFASLLSTRKTAYDSRLHVCVICGCYLPAKVHINSKYLDTAEHNRGELPDNCWRKVGV